MVINRQSYREKVSQMISWGHWFTLFNILLGLTIGSRYLFVSNWPASLLGRIYALASWLGHFSFIIFVVYLLIIFPLTFVIMSPRCLRFIATVLATAGLMLLSLDTEVFTRFHLHLNPVTWKLMLSLELGKFTAHWLLVSISVLIIFFLELFLARWCWKKLSSLDRKHFVKPLVALFICAFFASHLIYSWADANFYRPITMQRANLPLSYPMTARNFLEKQGLLNQQEYQRRLAEQGNPSALVVEYPLNQISFGDHLGNNYNLLLIVVDNIHTNSMATEMPALAQFAQANIQFNQHYSSGNRENTGLLGLFYGISASYLDGILAARKPSAFITALDTQGYQFGLFSSDGFKSSLYRQALLTDFSLPPPVPQRDSETTMQWQHWLTHYSPKGKWFSYLHLNNATAVPNPSDEKNTDQQITTIIETLKQQGQLDKTVVIITASHGVELNESTDVTWREGSQFNREQFQVPLIIHWPGMPAQQINKLTYHEDIMTTLMQQLLSVKTAAQDYSQGEDLFVAQRTKNWLVTGDSDLLVVITPTQTILYQEGKHRIYDQQRREIKDNKPSLSLLLQVLTDTKRFIAN
ncbi:LPS biosynthesis-modulating metalloenzyme YejM [Candidatus Regiella insecticola]|uniref:Inner membrane protein YejM n=1 Tax=Candidatus Regiella insecticola TaxID=138073 RepID=A0A6L2ZLA7_9ENTR|nr:LPS biosynthesis-modulating metalloenzyme YejM [Candidatus Regiella insecticola]GFN45130.1 hydrolase of alkaline phosphatase superfamily [Candidatus Regiella insecticola]